MAVLKMSKLQFLDFIQQEKKNEKLKSQNSSEDSKK